MKNKYESEVEKVAMLREVVERERTKAAMTEENLFRQLNDVTALNHELQKKGYQSSHGIKPQMTIRSHIPSTSGNGDYNQQTTKTSSGFISS